MPENLIGTLGPEIKQGFHGPWTRLRDPPEVMDGGRCGEPARVGFVARLRSGVKLDGVDAVVAQIQVDCDAARAILA